MVTILKKRSEIPGIVNRILRTYKDKPSDLHHLGESSLPDEKVIIRILTKIRSVIYPGYFGKSSVSRNGAEYYVGEQVMEIPFEKVVAKETWPKLTLSEIDILELFTDFDKMEDESGNMFVGG